MAKIDTLQDNFASTSVDTTKWAVTQNNALVNQSGGALVIIPKPSTSEYAKIASVATYDLTGSYALVKQEQLVAGSSTEQQLILQIDEDNKITLFYSNGGLICRSRAAASNSDTTPAFVAARDIWWRLRESAGTIYWDTSPDAVTWTNLRSLANPFAVTALTCELQAGNYDTAVATPGQAVFSHFNLPALVGFQRHVSVGNGMSRSESAK